MRFQRLRLGLLGTLAFLPAVAQVSNVSASQNANEKIARHQHGPIRDKTEHRDASNAVGSTTSSNWSGYAVLGSSFTSASGSWVVPTAICPGGDQYASFWVGLDGYSSNTVEQIGTDSDCDGTNPSYYAWYEFYPKGSFEVMSVSVKPGHVMSASVVYINGEFTVTITDDTGNSFTKSSRVAGAQRSSAEWIAEAPCCTAKPRDGILPLADFVTVNFGSDSATDSTTSGPISSFPTIWEINKLGSSSSPQTSTCSTLVESDDVTSFSCSWAP